MKLVKQQILHEHCSMWLLLGGKLIETEVELFTIGLTKISFQSMYAQVDGVKTSVRAQRRNKLYGYYSEQEKEEEQFFVFAYWSHQPSAS